MVSYSSKTTLYRFISHNVMLILILITCINSSWKPIALSPTHCPLVESSVTERKPVGSDDDLNYD